jgi:hypothetical protein
MTKTFVLVLLLNTWTADGKGAIEKIEGFSSRAACVEQGETFKDTAWAQYYYCIEVK